VRLEGIDLPELVRDCWAPLISPAGRSLNCGSGPEAWDS